MPQEFPVRIVVPFSFDSNEDVKTFINQDRLGQRQSDPDYSHFKKTLPDQEFPSNFEPYFWDIGTRAHVFIQKPLRADGEPYNKVIRLLIQTGLNDIDWTLEELISVFLEFKGGDKKKVLKSFEANISTPNRNPSYKKKTDKEVKSEAWSKIWPTMLLPLFSTVVWIILFFVIYDEEEFINSKAFTGAIGTAVAFFVGILLYFRDVKQGLKSRKYTTSI